MKRRQDAQLDLGLNEATKTMAHGSDPESSWMAAERHVKSGQQRTNLGIVLLALEKHPAVTAAELEALIGEPLGRERLTEVRRRLFDLRVKGLVWRCRKRKCKVANTLATTWRAK